MSEENNKSMPLLVCIFLTILAAAGATAVTQTMMTSHQGDIVQIISKAPSLIENAVDSAVEGETVSMTIIEGVNKGIEEKLNLLDSKIERYNAKIEALEVREAELDEGSLLKFCPGLNRKGQREVFKLAQMFAYTKSETDLSMDNAEQICMVTKEGCMECRLLGRTTPCDYSAGGGCSEVHDAATEAGAEELKSITEDVCDNFSETDAGWEDSPCNDG